MDVTYCQITEPNALLTGYFRLRTEIFYQSKGWKLNSTDQGFEYEQYDTPFAHYFIVHEGKEVIGGARVARTDQYPKITGIHKYSYMIRDACLGRLDGLPDDLCFHEPPVSPEVWEVTRLISARPAVGKLLFKRIHDFVAEQQGEKMIFLGSPVFLRVTQILGYDSRAIGPLTGNEDGKFLVMEVKVQPNRLLH